MAIDYSQNGEQQFILDYFGSFTGNLLDVGANDGETFSNSRQLILNGWSGTLIEPSLAYGKLSKLYDDNDRVACANAAFGSKEGFIRFYELQDSLLSTIHEPTAKSWNIPYQVTEVPVINKVEGAFDFITIDAEGNDWEILQQLDLSYTKCLCIEYGKYKQQITKYCEGYGLYPRLINGENIIFTI